MTLEEEKKQLEGLSKDQLITIVLSLRSILPDGKGETGPGRTRSRTPEVLPYYNIKEATILQPIIDEMIQDKSNREFFLKDNPGITLNTLFLRTYQALYFLADKDEKYSELKASVQIIKKDESVEIQFRPKRAPILASKRDRRREMPTPELPSIENSEKLKEIVNKIKEFALDSNVPADKVLKITIELSDDEQSCIKQEISLLENIAHKVTPNEIRILKLNTYETVA